MDHPVACETCCAGAPIRVRRRPRRLQTPAPSSIVHGRVARTLTLTSHRLSANDLGATPSMVNICVRQIRPRKRELRRTDSTLHTSLILSSCRTLGRILRKHASASLRLSLPNPTLTILKVPLSHKVLRDVRSFGCALPHASLDLGPHSHNIPSVRTYTVERDTPLDPSQIYGWNRNGGSSSGRREEHHLRNPNSRRRFGDQTAHD